MTTLSASNQGQPQTRFFDTYTRWMLGVMCALLLCVFASARYMSSHQMKGEGTDDGVNNMATQVTHGEHHPFIELPGDSELAAFSIANFFAGLIVGYHWLQLFGAGAVAAANKKEE